MGEVTDDNGDIFTCTPEGLARKPGVSKAAGVESAAGQAVAAAPPAHSSEY